MNKKVAVLTGFGLNCQDETEYACKIAGFRNIEQIHLNKFLNGSKKLADYHFLIIPGGFSGGDQLGAGVFFALKMEKLRKDIEEFIAAGKLILGICNGFQVLVNLGLLPGSLTYNDCGNFQTRWVKLMVNKNSPCIFTKGIECIELPIRHGEGKFWAPQEELIRIKENNQAIVKYASKITGNLAGGSFPENPNGSLDDIAGVANDRGTIFGLMPHPEDFNIKTNHPGWTREKIEAQNKKEEYSSGEEGGGIIIFRNARIYLENELK